ncbi:origin recognition complex subunit 1 [Caerostris darwini]|uniref:Origin recognition complex subunit 1 n=2 Tax=Caerostris TaxID=172845 RepID=A0AAV4W3Z4_9ARAC|nr:origin recognition complex subunit 1 [Caerostris darwini]
MANFNECDQEIRWEGERTVFVNRSKIENHYKVLYIDDLKLEIEDFVLVRNDDSVDPEDTSNCYVGQIKTLFHRDSDEKIPRATVQWFSRISELPPYVQKLIDQYYEWEVVEEHRSNWSDEIEADTIFSKCVVLFLPIDAECKMFEEHVNESEIPIFFCRYKYSGSKLLPVIKKNSLLTSEQKQYIATPTGTPEFPKVLIKRIDKRLMETPNARIIIAKPDAKSIEDVTNAFKKTLNFEDREGQSEKRPIIHTLKISKNELRDDEKELTLCNLPESSPTKPFSTLDSKKRILRNTPQRLSSLKAAENNMNAKNSPKKQSCIPHKTNVIEKSVCTPSPSKNSTRNIRSRKLTGNNATTSSSRKIKTQSLCKTPTTSRRSIRFTDLQEALAAIEAESSTSSPSSYKTPRKSKRFTKKATEVIRTPPSNKKPKLAGRSIMLLDEDIETENSITTPHKTPTSSKRYKCERLDKTPPSNKKLKLAGRSVVLLDDQEMDTGTPSNRTPKSNRRFKKLTDTPNVTEGKRTSQIPTLNKTPNLMKQSTVFSNDQEVAATRSGRKVKKVDYYQQNPDEEYKRNVLSDSSDDDDDSASECSIKKKISSNSSKKSVSKATRNLFSIPDRKTPLKIPQNILEESRMRLHAAAVPKSLPCREEEYSDIYKFVRDSLCLQTGGCMYISGVPGTGKTATVHEVIRNLEEEKENGEVPFFTFVEVNGMWMTDPYKCYVHIFKSLTGKSIASQQACNLLEKRFTEKGPKKDAVVLLVDELDRLWTRKQTVMYNIFDWPSKPSSKLIVLAIANTMDLPERLMMNRVKSRLGLSRITFQPYNFRQLQEIIMNRIQELKVFDPDAVQFVARKVAAVSGDARRALAICRNATEIVEKGDLKGSKFTPSKKQKILVGMEHVDEAIQQMFSSPVIAFIKSSSKMTKLFLEGMLNEFTRTGSEETTLLKVSNHIDTICKFEGIRPPSSSIILTICVRLAASHVVLVDDFRNDIHMKLRLGVDPDDVNYALTGKGPSH